MCDNYNPTFTIGCQNPTTSPFTNRFLSNKKPKKLTKEEYDEFRHPDYRYCCDAGERIYNPLRNATDEAIDHAIDIQEVADNAEEALSAIESLKHKLWKIKQEVRETSQQLANFIHSTEFKLTQMERDHSEEIQDLRNSI